MKVNKMRTTEKLSGMTTKEILAMDYWKAERYFRNRAIEKYCNIEILKHWKINDRINRSLIVKQIKEAVRAIKLCGTDRDAVIKFRPGSAMSCGRFGFHFERHEAVKLGEMIDEGVDGTCVIVGIVG